MCPALLLLMTDFISIHITASSQAEADTLSNALVESQLASCVNIMPIKSVYRWQGKVERASEFLLIVKSRASLFKEIEAKVKGLHSYDCPCILAMPITHGHQPTFDWLEQETKS